MVLIVEILDALMHNWEVNVHESGTLVDRYTGVDRYAVCDSIIHMDLGGDISWIVGLAYFGLAYVSWIVGLAYLWIILSDGLQHLRP